MKACLRADNRLLNLGLVLIVAWALIWCGFGAARAAESSQQLKKPSLDTARSQAVFTEVLRLIDQFYVEPVSTKELLSTAWTRLTMALPPHCVEGADGAWPREPDAVKSSFEKARSVAATCDIEPAKVLSTLLNLALKELDKNTCLLDRVMVKELRISLSGEFGGVGMTVSTKAGRHVVLSVSEGSPAQRAGIRPGDSVLEIDGTPIEGLTLPEVLDRVRGAVGSVIWLTVEEAKTETVRHMRLRRASIHVRPVRSAVLGDGVGYVRILSFQKSTATATKKALRDLKRQIAGKPKGLVLDLRDNPGGLFDQAIQVADLFIDSGLITSLRGRGGQLHHEFKASRHAMMPLVPVVVLINSGTASAAEVLAGAMKGRAGVVLMGHRSFGKASVQAVYLLTNGEALRLTTAHYYTATGCDIEGKGLEPDVESSEAAPSAVPESENRDDETGPLADAMVKQALELLKGKASGQELSRLSRY
jgi:carboxyl-terminal processing protease